jgi:hypothetical protein
VASVSPLHTSSAVSSLQDGEQEAEKEAGAKVYEKDDFFDSLSCEALDRMAIREAGEDARVDGRARNAAQRKVPVVWALPACCCCWVLCAAWTARARCSSAASVPNTAVYRRLCVQYV